MNLLTLKSQIKSLPPDKYESFRQQYTDDEWNTGVWPLGTFPHERPPLNPEWSRWCVYAPGIDLAVSFTVLAIVNTDRDETKTIDILVPDKRDRINLENISRSFPDHSRLRFYSNGWGLAGDYLIVVCPLSSTYIPVHSFAKIILINPTVPPAPAENYSVSMKGKPTPW